MLAPHPSIIKVLINYHLRILHAPLRFAIHLFVIYTLTILAFTSLIIIVFRDPGRVGSSHSRAAPGADAEGEVDLTEALLSMDDPDFNSPGKWCRKCWAPKP